MVTKKVQSPSWFGSVDRASACRPKGPGFDSGQGHVPWLQAPPRPGPWLELMQEATNRCVSLTSMFLSVFPSLFHSLSKSMEKYSRVRINKTTTTREVQSRCWNSVPRLSLFVCIFDLSLFMRQFLSSVLPVMPQCSLTK
uniref:Uncharacterized protein n=1 Tax=Myotis myotis TaxID=51298 RepID=A0A7J7T6S3_MYOMY|nr:hypothetical protein mMyoMyo1_009211 [Myotis myotis]